MNYVTGAMTLRAACARHVGASSLLQAFHGALPTRTSGLAWPLIRTIPSPRAQGCQFTATFSTSHSFLAPPKRKNAKPKRVTKQSPSPLGTPSVAKEKPSKPAPTQPPVAPRKPAYIEQPRPARKAEPALTWRDYDPEGGMPLQGRSPAGFEPSHVFAGKLDNEMADYVICQMNWRRQSGALIDLGTKFSPDRGVTHDQAVAALEHIRRMEPDFDEEAAGMTWVEEESQRLRQGMQERSKELGIYKRDPSEEAELAEEEWEELDAEQKQGTAEGRKRSAESALLQERRRREAEFDRQQEIESRKQEAAEVAAVRSARGPLELGGGVQPGYALVKADSKEVEATKRLEKSKAWREEYAKKSDPFDKNAQVPQLSLLARLGPSFCFVVATVAFAVFLADNYVAAPTSARMFPDIPAKYLTIGSLTAILTGFFFLCRWPPFYSASLKYFAIWPPVPRAVSMIGASLQHHGLRHLLTNIAVLWGIGLTLHEDIGRGAFLAVLLGCGALGGFSALTFEVLHRNWNFYTVGASSAILGMFATTCTIQPERTFRVFGHDVKLAVWLVLAFSLTADFIGCFTRFKYGIDFVGHLGGQLSGIAAGLYLRRRQAQAQAAPANKDESKS